MFVSTQDAIRIYARACRSWYGSRARKMALTRAHELQQRGDLEGSQVWRQLADEIERGGTPAGNRSFMTSATTSATPRSDARISRIFPGGVSGPGT
jgi:hypothetical protein